MLKLFTPLLEFIGDLYSLAIGLLIVLPAIGVFILAICSHLVVYKKYNQTFVQNWGVKFGSVLKICRSLHGLIDAH
jgi:hypothetical protein